MASGATMVAVGGAACAPTAGGGCVVAVGGVLVTVMGADNVATGLLTAINPSGNYATGGATLCSAATGQSIGACELQYAGAQILTGGGVAVGTRRLVINASDDIARTTAGAADDAARQLAAEMDRAVIPAGQTCVYSCVVNGQTVYVGITDDIIRRGTEHLAEKGIVIRGIRGLESLSRADAHAVEQVLIEFYGLGRNGGTLLNKINAISPTRNRTAYEQALTRGASILRNIQYPGF